MWSGNVKGQAGFSEPPKGAAFVDPSQRKPATVKCDSLQGQGLSNSNGWFVRLVAPELLDVNGLLAGVNLFGYLEVFIVIIFVGKTVYNDALNLYSFFHLNICHF